jgi:hypothetical protein
MLNDAASVRAGELRGGGRIEISRFYLRILEQGALNLSSQRRVIRIQRLANLHQLLYPGLHIAEVMVRRPGAQLIVAGKLGSAMASMFCCKAG